MQVSFLIELLYFFRGARSTELRAEKLRHNSARHPALVAAVSEAGGLGVLGVAPEPPPGGAIPGTILGVIRR